MASGLRDHRPSMAQYAQPLPQTSEATPAVPTERTSADVDAFDEQLLDLFNHDEQLRHDNENGGLLRESVHNRHRKEVGNRFRQDIEEDDQQRISIPTSEETVMPFLMEHIPLQYNTVNMLPREVEDHQELVVEKVDTRFCYRHRSDLKCRRQANEPSMAHVQNELATLSHSDQQAISHVWSLFSAAPAKHRNLMIQGILTQCCFPQLSYISGNVRELIKVDFLAALPAELGFKVLCYLDTASLCKATQVSQRWRSLADDDVVWHKMCEQHIDRKCTKCGVGLPLLEQKRLRSEKRQIQLRARGRGLNQWSPAITPIPEEQLAGVNGGRSLTPAEGSSTSGLKRTSEDDSPSPELSKRPCPRTVREEGEDQSDSAEDSYNGSKKRPWKDVYKDRFKVGTAWKYGRFSTRVFRGHTNGVMCVQFDDHVLMSGSYDSTVKIWNVNTGEEIKTLKGHRSGIRCLQFDDTKLMTGSLDNTLKLWNWRTGQCLRTFPAHTGGIIALHFTTRYVASGSMDKTIRVWDSETKQTFLLRGHTEWINSVKVDEPSRTLFSASDDLTIRIWDLDNKTCIKVFEGHVGQIQQVQPLPVEFDLEEPSRRAQAAAEKEKEDDASSVGSATTPLEHSLLFPQQQERRSPTPTERKEPFWYGDLQRPAPPRYMLSGALDSTIRLWDVHASQGSKTATTTTSRDLDSSSTSAGFAMLPTDPLTNSHTPRAQACVRTFFGHVEGIWALSADHLRLISGSEDRMMKVWDPRTGKCERTFTGHAGPVTCTWLSDSRVASGSEDCEVRMLCFGDT